VIKTQFTLYMRNRPGELARAIRGFAAEKVNIEGISVAQTTDLSVVQLVAGNARAARRLFKESRTAMTEQRVAVLPLDNQPGALAAAATRLARKKININYLYATSPPAGSGAKSHVVISSDDLAKVEALWRR
jgi:hypothetical protein